MGRLMLAILSCLYIASSCHALTDTITQGQRLEDWKKLVSKRGIFTLGFFMPGSSNHYLGIWYSNEAPSAAVWVANRESPTPDSSGILILDSDGKLKITYDGGQPIVISSNPSVSGNVAATLQDDGNFVLRQVGPTSTGTGKEEILWQSFDYPTHVLLPGMKLGMNLKTGHNWSLTSWSSDQLPFPGAFRLGVELDQMVMWRRGDVYWNSGVWKVESFQMVPELTRMFNQHVGLYEFNYVTNQTEKYFLYSVRNTSTLPRLVMTTQGRIWGHIVIGNFNTSLLWENQTDWADFIVNTCIYKIGTRKKTYQCIKEKESECRNSSQLFVATTGYVNGSQYWYYNNSHALTHSDCQASCWKNCTCVAFQTIKDGTGCVMWDRSTSIPDENFNSLVYLLKQTTDTGGTPTVIQPAAEMQLDSTRNKIRRRMVLSLSGTGAALALLSFLCCLMKRKVTLSQQTGERKSSQDNPLIATSNRKGCDLQLYSFSQIAAATDNFSSSNKLGEGGFGPVYKGKLIDDGQEVAIKRLSRSSSQGLVEFKNEILLIAELQHMNLVRLLGYCTQEEENMLVYEYLPNKSLDSFLSDPKRRKFLDWKRRYSIIEGIAQGLLYLHKYSRLRVIHRDLKPSNILLDHEMNPKISDFGMARIFGQNISQANTNRVVGTYGYMSPEYAMNGIFSEKSDVFSFGILLLQIVSGNKNTVFFHSSGPISLIEHAWDMWKKGQTPELMDMLLDSSCHEKEHLRCVHIGLLCVQDCANNRPAMSDVISMLTNETMFLPVPKQPAFYTGRSEIGATLTIDQSDNCSVNDLSTSVMVAR